MVNLAFPTNRDQFLPKRPAMDERDLRHLIRAKLADGRLQQRQIKLAWGGPANGETCIACEASVRKGRLVIEAIGQEAVLWFHVRCFQAWYAERAARETDGEGGGGGGHRTPPTTIADRERRI